MNVQQIPETVEIDIPPFARWPDDAPTVEEAEEACTKLERRAHDISPYEKTQERPMPASLREPSVQNGGIRRHLDDEDTESSFRPLSSAIRSRRPAR